MRPKTILLVDDEPLMRNLILACLRTLPAEFVLAVDGHEALALAALYPIDLVLVDVEMPGMDGTALVRALRADDRLRRVPVLIVTGTGCSETRRALSDLGVRGIYAKPFSPSALLTQVTEIFNEPIAAERFNS